MEVSVLLLTYMLCNTGGTEVLYLERLAANDRRPRILQSADCCESLSEASLVHPWGLLGGPGGCWGGSWGSRGGPGRVFSPLRRHLGGTCRQHGGQDGNLQATWPNLGRTGAVLDGSGAVLGGSGAILRRSWGHLGAVLAPSGAILGPSWGHLGRS